MTVLVDSRAFLHQALASSDPLYASTAARLLAAMADEESIDVLIQYCRSSRSYSKTVGIQALVDLNARDALPMLEALVMEPNVPDDFYWIGLRSVRVAAAVALLQWGNDTGAGHLKTLLTAEDVVVRRFYAPAIMRTLDPVADELKAIMTLDYLWTAAGSASLNDTAYSDPCQIALLCDALVCVDDPSCDDILGAYLDFHSRYVRSAAATALGQRGNVSMAEIEIALQKTATDFEQITVARLQADAGALQALVANAVSDFDRATALDALVDDGHSVDHGTLQRAFSEGGRLLVYAAIEACMMQSIYDMDFSTVSDDNDPLAELRLHALVLKQSVGGV